MRLASYIKQGFFLILAALIGSYAFIQYKDQIKQEQQQEQASLLFDQIKSADEVIEISLKKPDELIRMSLKDSRWMLDSPVKDLGNNRKIKLLVSDLLKEKGELISTAPDSWSEYDLDKPGLKLTLKTNKSIEHVLSVSKEPSFNGEYFLRKGEDLYLGKAEFKSYLESTSETYRNSQIYISKSKPSTFSIRKKGQRWHRFIRKQSEWTWKKKSQYPLSSSKVRRYLDHLSRDQILEFTSKKKTSFQKQASWIHPDLYIQTSFVQAGKSSKPKTWWLKVNMKNKAPEAEIMMQDRAYIYKVKKSFIKALTEFNFKDNKAPFKAELHKLHEVKIKVNNLDILIRKNPALKQETKSHISQWEVLKPKGHKVSRAGWSSFLKWVGQLETNNYYKKKLPLNKGRIELKTDKNKILLKLDFGSTFTDKHAKKQIYLKSNKMKELLSIDFSTYQKVVSDSIIEKQ